MAKKNNESLFDLVFSFIVFVSIFIGIYSKWQIGLTIFILLIFVLRTFSRMIQNKKDRLKMEMGLSEIDKMTGIQFEDWLRVLFSNLGYSITTTPSTNDYGADLIIRKGNEIRVIQAKRYKKRVGIRAVQEVVGAVAHYKATHGSVVTNNYFTTQAEQLARSNNIKLVDRDQLIKLYQEGKKNQR